MQEIALATAQILPLPKVYAADATPRAQRLRMVESALGTTLAEGVSPDAEVIAMSERYVSGEITLQELSTAIRAMSGL